jgi:hypothetical protein
MTHASTKKRKSILIISVVIATLVISSIGAIVAIYFAKPNDSITVSGKVDSSALSQPFLTSLQTIEFIDTQTGAKTSFRFPFATHSDNPFGDYSVSLKNEHTYSIIVSYYTGPTTGNMYPASDNLGSFTVHAATGKKAISQNFPGPIS